MTKVIWKTIPEHLNYKVSNFGNVKSLNYRRTGKEGLLKNSFCKKTGYYCVHLSKNKKGTYIRIHVLVAMAFLGHVRCGFKKIVDHKNNIRTDNRVENLHIITQRNNSTKDKKNKTGFSGITHCNNKYTAHISFNRKIIYLGIFDSDLEASNKYNEAKEFIELNGYLCKSIIVKKPNKSGIKGVYVVPNGFSARIRVGKKYVCLGTYKTTLECFNVINNYKKTLS